MPPRTESWSILPPELLVKIADNHSTHLGVLRLRSICRSWRYSVSSDCPSDASIRSVRIPFPILNQRDLYPLIKSTICHVESSVLRKKWLVKIEEIENGKLRALDPVSSIRMLRFPKYSNFMDLRVFEIARSFSFSGLERRKSFLNLNKISKKVVVSSVDGNVKSDDLIMVVYDGGSLSHIRIGDDKWGEVKEWQIMKLYSDVIFRSERFYAVDGGGGLVIVDRRLNVEIFPWLGPSQDSCEKKYLLEAGGCLFLVIKKIISAKEDCGEESTAGRVSEEDEDCRIWFEVFCLKEKEKHWIQVYSLGELAFFVTDDCSFSVVACDSPMYQRNCIYYADYDVADSKAPSCGVYNLEKRLLSRASGYCFMSVDARHG